MAERTAHGRPRALVIGAGPAGLMAAETLALSGCAVTVAEAKPSVGRKLLMAGKSGLNLTRDQPFEAFMDAYGEAAPWLRPILAEFDAAAVQDWARGLGQELFAGSTGRVFPTAMKASPLLRAWLARLRGAGVEFRTRWRWTGWDGSAATFDTPAGVVLRPSDVTVLALGGASWSRLGSDGAWAPLLTARGVDIAAFAPANAGISVAWSSHMRPLLGQPVKGVRWCAGALVSRGEAVISARGLEGGGIYSVSRGVREGHDLTVDLCPDLALPDVVERLSRPPGKSSLANRLRKSLKLDRARIALLNEFARPLPRDPDAQAALLKAMTVRHAGLRPLDEAISTAGGVARSALSDGLMLTALPGVFCAGEMLDWEAPTGGYLLTACLATGRCAGRAGAGFAGLG
ncbi:MAG: TIGR03862 family flavoprotein [Jhaorihella sp.]